MALVYAFLRRQELPTEISAQRGHMERPDNGKAPILSSSILLCLLY